MKEQMNVMTIEIKSELSLMSSLIGFDSPEWCGTTKDEKAETVFEIVSSGVDLAPLLQRFKEKNAVYRDSKGKIQIPNFICGLAILADHLEKPGSTYFQDLMVERRAQPYAGWTSAEQLLLDSLKKSIS